MSKNIYVSIVSFLLLPSVCFAKTSIICEPPEGLRVDYFENSTAHSNKTFLKENDRVSGMNPKIIFDEDNKKEVIFILGNTSSLNDDEKMVATMKVVYDSKEQISFAGVINHASILASYYPEFHILVYSQHSDWSPIMVGMRSMMFFSRCSKE